MSYLKEKLTKRDVSDISKGVTAVFGRRIGWLYEVNHHPDCNAVWGATPLKHMVGEIPADYIDPEPTPATSCLEIVAANSRENIEDAHYNYFYARKENGKWIVSE